MEQKHLNLKFVENWSMSITNFRILQKKCRIIITMPYLFHIITFPKA